MFSEERLEIEDNFGPDTLFNEVQEEVVEQHVITTDNYTEIGEIVDNTADVINNAPEELDEPHRSHSPPKRKRKRKILSPSEHGVRKSSRMASKKCSKFLKQIAVRLTTDSDDEIWIPQVDGNYTLDNDDPKNVFDAESISFFSGEKSSVRTAQSVQELSDSVRTYQLTQQLDLAVTEQYSAVLSCPPRVRYENPLTRSRILSISAGSLPDGDHVPVPESSQRSRWRKRLLRLRAFLDRLPLFRHQ